MLEVHDLVVKYGDVTVLRELSLDVREGEIVGLLGRNGMGKTTLMRAVSGLLRPTSGSITLEGRDITRTPPHARARSGVVLVAQGRGVFEGLTVHENLKMGRISARRDGDRDRLDDVLRYFPPLGERMDQRAGTMSGGEQQMLVTGRALMAAPRLLLLDEPSDGIMPTLVRQLARIIREINESEGLTTVVVEQNVPMVFSMATRCLLLEKGRIVAEGTPSELEGSQVLKKHLAI